MSSNFINEHNTLRNKGDYSTQSVIDLLKDNEEVSQVNNITSEVGNTILGLRDKGDFDVSKELKHYDIQDMKKLHNHLKTLSTNINSYIQNRNWKQRFKDIFSFRFITLYRLQRNLPKILATIIQGKKPNLVEELNADIIQTHMEAMNRALSTLTDAAKAKKEARTQKQEVKTRKKEEKPRKKEKLEPAVSELSKEAETEVQAKLQKEGYPASKQVSNKTKPLQEKKSYYLEAIAFVKQKIEEIKDNLTNTAEIPAIGLRSSNLSFAADFSREEAGEVAVVLDDLKPIAEIPAYCKEENCVKYAENLGILNKRISKLEKTIAHTNNNNDFKEAAEKHLKKLQHLRTELLDDKPIEIPDYGKDAVTQKKDTMLGALLKRASAETTKKSSQMVRIDSDVEPTTTLFDTDGKFIKKNNR